jgi:GNAT superfamily N-acetyltransferase
MKTKILPFSGDMIPEAARLLATRHLRNRTKLPLLPQRFEDEQAACESIEALYNKRLHLGYAAFRHGRMVAYLIGEYTTQPWGRCGYVYLPGYALAEDEDPSILQDLYALLGDDWVENGVFSHSLYISAADQHIIDALFHIGFGRERVDGLIDLRTLNIPEVEDPVGLTVRVAGMGDNELLGSLSHIIMNALAGAPSWHPTVPEIYQELKDGWSELADDKDWRVWMAVENGQALGTAGFRPVEKEDPQILVPSPRTIYLSVVATRPEARGRGIANLLTWRGLEEARKNGFEFCYTNWISQNFLAARYWPRFGFTDVAYRLSKRINPMIAWTAPPRPSRNTNT